MKAVIWAFYREGILEQSCSQGCTKITVGWKEIRSHILALSQSFIFVGFSVLQRAAPFPQAIPGAGVKVSSSYTYFLDVWYSKYQVGGHFFYF